MASIVKEKNFLIYTNDNGNVYKFDISTGIMYSTKGKAMKSQPAGLVDCIWKNRNNSVLLGYMYCQHNWNSLKYNDFSRLAHNLIICDKLDSIGFTTANPRSYSTDLLEFVNTHFKAFVKFHNEHNDLSLDNFKAQYEKTLWLEQNGIKVGEYYTQDMVDKLYNIIDTNNTPTEQVKLIAYYLAKGVYEFVKDNPICPYNGELRRMFEQFFEMSKIIGHKPTKDDFFKQYVMVKKIYYANKKEYDNAMLKAQYDKHSLAWQFETDDLFVYVPKSVEDFKDEANQQHNCVYTSYLDSVLGGETNVVFIRKKSEPKKSHITCEVTNDGTIRQFRYAYNYYVPFSDRAETEFEEKFSNWLNENWN